MTDRYHAELFYHPTSFWRYSVKIYRPDDSVYWWQAFRRQHKAEKYAQDRVEELNAGMPQKIKEY